MKPRISKSDDEAKLNELLVAFRKEMIQDLQKTINDSIVTVVWPLAKRADEARWAESADGAKLAQRLGFAEHLRIAVASAVITAILLVIVSGIGYRYLGQQLAALKAQITIPVVTPAKIDAPDTVPIFNGTSELPAISQLHTIVISVDTYCWLQAGTLDNNLQFEGSVLSGWSRTFTGVKTLSLRAGCPGKINYWIDGVIVYPKNQATNPRQVEVVTLPE